MMISIEGGIGSGKTELTKILAGDIGTRFLLEEYDKNPFLSGFYERSAVDLENEITFLMIHYNQIHSALQHDKASLVLTDFSIEKDIAFARENLEGRELEIFEDLYEYTVSKVGFPTETIFLDLSIDRSWNFIKNRGRSYEVKSDKSFIEKYNKKLKEFFLTEAKSKVVCIDAEKLSFNKENSVYTAIKNKVLYYI